MVTKSGRRLVVYISEELRAKLNGWVDSENISLADFTRDALEAYLDEKQREQRNAELKTTCQIVSSRDHSRLASIET